MVKKVLIINGSYHRKGMVFQLVENFCQGLKEQAKAVLIENVFLADLKFAYCEGYHSCTMHKGSLGKCPLKDDVTRMLPKLLACDVLVYATPVYMMGPTALMKKFMERNLPCLAPSTGMPKGRAKVRKDKYGVLLLSTGAPYPFNIIFGLMSYSVKILTWLCKLWGCGKVYKLQAGGMELNKNSKKYWLKKSFLLGQMLGQKLY